jgi:hypothetical protein
MKNNKNYPPTPQNHKKGLRDPIWQFIWGFVSAILAIIGIIVTILALPQARQVISQTLSQTPAATTPPTATPSPAATPSPTPTPITITKNLNIPCLSNCAIALKLTTIVIDPTTQTSTWNFTLINTTNSVRANFSSLELEDNTGQKHQGAGPAKTDTWDMGSSQIIHTNAIFDVMHGTNYILNLAITYNTWYTDTHVTVTITF